MVFWWRVLRGVRPYAWSVVISMVCALGVGLSYASGVAVMLPVMKIFVSAEGVHGWANRTAAEKRLDVSIQDKAMTEKRLEGALALLITDAGQHAPPGLHPSAGVNPRIVRVRGTLDGQSVESTKWLGNKQRPGMVDIAALADAGTSLEVDVLGAAGQPATLALSPRDLRWHDAVFVNIIRRLPDDAWWSLFWVMLFFVGLCIIGSIFRYYQQFIGLNVANRVVMDLRRKMYDRVVLLPTSYFAQKGTSDLMSRLTQDTNTLTDGVGMALGKAVQEPIKAVCAFGVALWIDWRLCLLVVFTMPILGVIIRKFSKRMRRAAKGALESWSSLLAVINETLIGARVVKAYSGEGYERRRFARVNKQLLREQTRLNHYGSLSRPVIETLAVILCSIPMMAAAKVVLSGTIQMEPFFVLLACFVAMLEPMRKLADVNSKVQQTNAAAARVFEIVDMSSEPNHNHALPKLPRHTRAIEFDRVTFSYPGHEEVVLKEVSLGVPHGRTVAVVGGNGSGKTTLLSLLPRLYVPTGGRILIDGVDIAGVSIRSLRKQIGLVTQDTLLFADTIYNNIAYGTRHATEEQVYDAARRAYADEFIRGFPDGYATLVGEHGVRLSGGQKQRLAIARAILHDPAILILDEAMSQIDSDSEMKIAMALREFTANRTTFMIAHRFQTVISADLIMCLDQGRLVGTGTHHHLLATCAPYRRLYENQFRESAEAGEAAAESAAEGALAPTTPA